MLSAVVLTYNEVGILPRCLEGLSFADHVLVFDSHSTDRTREIARDSGAQVIERTFDNYAAQRNAAMASVPEETEWILMVDADEIIGPELRNEILKVLASDPVHDLYRIRRKDHFRGRWIRYSSGYPTWFPRLFRKGKVRVLREINEEYQAEGSSGELLGHLEHFPFNKGMEWWMDKHRRYAEMEARVMLEETRQPIGVRNLLSGDPILRRKAQKRLSYHLPFRPAFVFLAFYFLKRGFLDGRAGLEFCKLRYRYEKMIAIRHKSLKTA